MIIGIAGKKRVGKSTAAGFLEDIGFHRFAFAEPLKFLIDMLLLDVGLTEEQLEAVCRDKEASIEKLGVSYRWLCQSLGTEWGRNCIHPDLWVMTARTKLANLLALDDAVFEDVRFENEAVMVRELGGFVLHIDRDLPHNDQHVSEAGVEWAEGDVRVKNSGDIDLFHKIVLEAVLNKIHGEMHEQTH